MFYSKLLSLILAAFISNAFTQSYKESNKILTEWTLVDTMGNSFGPASSLINPIAYDFGSNALILVHRGSDVYTPSSGEIWYNLSTDLGNSWSRICAINSSLTPNGRYPNTAILNPDNGGLSGTTGVFTWISALSGSPGYGIDQPLGNGTPQAAIDLVFSYSIIPWTDGQWAFWVGSAPEAYSVARTNDFSTIEHYILNNHYGAYILGGVGQNGNEYVGFIGPFPDPDPGNPIYSGFYPAYYKSTDYGQTWGEFQVVDFRTIPSLSNFDRLYDYIKNDQYLAYTGDINVDKDGFVHLILTVTDTTVNNNTGDNALVEVFETDSGWEGKVIYDGIGDDAYTTYGGPAIHQMGPCGYLAFDKDREQMACLWVSDSPTSSLGLCDVYISWRNLDSDNWSQPENLTQTDNMNENGAHLAPQLYSDMNSNYKAFAGYFYELGYYGPTPDTLNQTGFWVAAVNHTETGISSNDTEVRGFDLLQNYPNPFNPATNLSFVIGSASGGSFVTLRVYDVLGNEVATLVNEEKPAGSYNVKFDGSGLSSGIYYYKLNSGNFIMVKKMLLLK